MSKQEVNAPSTSRKPFPWIKFMVLVMVLMGSGAITVQVLKGRKAAELAQLRAEQAEATRKANVWKAVENTRVALKSNDLDSAEQHLKLALGLDIKNDFTNEINHLKIQYKQQKALADKERREQEARDAQLKEKLRELEAIALKEDLEEKSSEILTLQQQSRQIIKAGVSAQLEVECRKLNLLIEERKAEQNGIKLQKLLKRSSGLESEQSIDEGIQKIRSRTSQPGVPEVLQSAAKSTIDELQKKKQIIQTVKLFQTNLSDENWRKAKESLAAMRALGAGENQIGQYRNHLEKMQKQAEARDARVRELFEQLNGINTDSYNPSAMLLVDAILAESPRHEGALSLKKKLQSHLDSLKVPSDVASLDEAVRLLNENGCIELGEGIFYTEIVIEKPLKITGQGVGKTVLECRGDNGPSILIKEKAGTVQIANLSIRGTEYIGSEERNALVLVSGKARMEDCEISQSPGHGVAVLGGDLQMERCKASQNGWDGVSVKGRGSKATLTDCLIEGNSEHGVDFWEGAAGTVFRSKVFSSSGSGIVATGQSRVTIAQTAVESNREAGIHVSGGALVKLDKVVAQKNAFSGVVVQGAGTSVEMTVVASAENEQAGYFIDPASQVQGLGTATGEGNKQGKVVRKRSAE